MGLKRKFKLWKYNRDLKKLAPWQREEIEQSIKSVVGDIDSMFIILPRRKFKRKKHEYMKKWLDTYTNNEIFRGAIVTDNHFFF